MEIFSYLNIATLGTSCLVSKEWKRLAEEPTLWKNAIYKEIAFGNDKWAKCFGKDIVKDEDSKEEFSSLSVVDIIRDYRSFKKGFPEKNVKDELMLVRLPKTLNGQLTLKSLGDLAKRYFPKSNTGYKYIWSSIVDELGDKSIEKSCWTLMTKDVLPGSRHISYAKQQNLVTDLAKKALVGYEVPKALEAAVCILAQYFSSNTRLFSYSPCTYTRCQVNVHDQVIVERFAPDGLCIGYEDDNIDVGVAALRKFF